MEGSIRREVWLFAVPVLVIGIWGGIVPFVGPTFGFYMGGKVAAWTWSESHFTLHVVPAIATVLGAGAMLLGRRPLVQGLGGLLAMLGGVWFVLGPSLHPLWAGSTASSGMAHGGMMHGASAMAGSSHMGAWQAVGYHYGTGAAIAVLSAVALGLLLATVTVPATAGERAARAPRRRVQMGPAVRT